MDRLEEIVNRLVEENIVEYYLRRPKKAWDTQTVYGDLCDYMRDFHNDLSLHEREIVIERLLGKYVIKNIYKVKLY